MKKYLALLFSVLYLISSNACFAVSHLYFLKNTNKQTIAPIVINAYSKQKFNLRKQDPYLGISEKNAGNYAVTILQTSSDNVFYYFESNGNKKINNLILKELKNKNIIYEESLNSTYLSTFENQASNILNGTSENTYNFETPVQQTTNNVTNNSPENQNVLRGYVGQIAKGTKFNVYLQTPINTANANVNDSITAILSEDWIYNGNLVATQGSRLNGYLSKARHATYGSRNGRVVIKFTDLTTPDGKSFKLNAEEIDFTVTNDGKLGSVSGKVLTGVISGVLIGLLIAACSSASTGKSAAIGAGAGAGAGLLMGTAEAGVDAEIPIYTELEIELAKPINMVFSY